MKIYVPEDSTFNKCYVLQSEGVIRAYDVLPRNNIQYNYIDFYINSHYLTSGTRGGTWGNTSSLPTCILSDNVTHQFYYRNDFPDILLTFFLLSIICFYFPFKIFKCLFKGLR